MPRCCGTASPCGAGIVLRRKLLLQRQKRHGNGSRLHETSAEVGASEPATDLRVLENRIIEP
jgi:hypothetical protein